MIPFVFAYVALATWTAWLADRKGRSFWVYFVFCLLVPGAALPAVMFLALFARRR